MASVEDFILGEFPRSIDERFRISIPGEFVEQLSAEEKSGKRKSGQSGDCILAKERSGCLSLWNSKLWQEKIDSGVELVRGKIKTGRLEGRIEQVQMLGRLLSTRHKTVQLAGRGRLLVPEGFREFLGAEPGGDVLLVGAAVCLEIWRPTAWFAHLEQNMPQFRQLFDELAG